MSFSYNPLKHIEIVDDPPIEGYSTNLDPNTYAVYCHSCGSSKERIRKDAPIGVAFDTMRLHLERSHHSKMQHFDSWSTF